MPEAVLPAITPADAVVTSARTRRREGRRAARGRLGKPLLPLWLAVLIAAAAGPVMDAAYPAIAIPWLVFPAIAMVLLTNIGRSLWGSVLVGAVYAASFHLIHIVWITRYLGPVPWFALTGLETVLFAAGTVFVTLAYRWLPRVAPGRLGRVVVLPLVVAAAWTTRELWMGTWPYTGFPWTRIGMSQAATPLGHVASWVGVSGLTFLMVLAVAMVIEAVRTSRTVPRPVLSFLPALVVSAVLALTPAFPTTPAGTMRVGSVQGNGPAGYFDDRSERSVFQAQLDATAPIVDDDLDVLLWPEGGIDWDVLKDDGVHRVLDRLSTRIDAPLIVNSATTRGDHGYNTSVLWDAEGGALAHHDKRNPVPMGEYVPDRWFYEAIAPDLIGLIQREYTPGTNAPVFDVEGVKVGLAICFDVIYDGVVHEGARDGAEVYMFQTNNADFRDTDENLQQLEFARMRAVETGRSVVNISTVGTSQVIAPNGSVIDSLPAGAPGAMVTDVPLRTGLTPAVIAGGAIQLAIVVFGVGSLVVSGLLVRRRR